MPRDRVIEDHGRWGWSLTVTADGDVVARQAIPYDGVLTYSTAGRPNYPGKNSEYQLDVREVVRRYVRESETDSEVEDLIDEVQVALGEVADV